MQVCCSDRSRGNICHDARIILGDLDLCDRIVPVAADGLDHISRAFLCRNLFQRGYDQDLVGVSVAIGIQEQDVAVHAHIGIRLRQDLFVSAKLHHVVNTRTPGNRILGYIRIVQAEGGKHRRPITVGVSVPLTVSGNSLPGFTILGEDKVLLAFCDSELRQSNAGQVF